MSDGDIGGMPQHRNMPINGRWAIVLPSVFVALVTALLLMAPAVSATHDTMGPAEGLVSAEGLESADPDEQEAEQGPADSERADGGEAADNPAQEAENPAQEAEAAAEPDEAAAPDEAETPTEDGKEPDDSAAAEGAEGKDEADDDVVDSPESDDADAKADTAEAPEEADDPMPAAEFAQDLKDKKQNVILSVAVKAPQGAFPKGTTMKVARVAAKDVRGKIEAAVQDEGYEPDDIKGFTAVDIAFLTPDGSEVEPAREIEVRITSDAVREAENPMLVHILDPEKQNQQVEPDPETGETPEAEVVPFKPADKRDDCDTLVFTSDKFSVYAIVDTPELPKVYASSVDDLVDGTKFLLSYGEAKNYFTNSLNNKGCLVETTDADRASEWYFEAASGQEGQYYLYTYVSGQKKYLRNKPGGNNVELADTGTALEVSVTDGGKFYLKAAGENKWLQHSNGGGGIRFYTDNNNAANSQITITIAENRILPDDAYQFDGKTFGIAYNDNSATASGLVAGGSATAPTLSGQSMVIRPDVLTHKGVLLVAKDSEISEWAFHSVDKDRYQLSTVVGDQTKYLAINGSTVSLVDTPGDASVVTVTPGSGTQGGKWHFTVDGKSLNLNGATVNAADGNGATTWLNLVEKSPLDDDDFNLYTAKKVSVSDTVNVADKKQVVIYTRVWNETTKRYDFYVVDHDGSLARCYDTGGNVEWVGSQVNTALWEFTEYKDDDGSSNYYYELQNVQYGNYLAPQMTGNQVTSDDALGINLRGREHGQNNTTISAWDSTNYSYTGLKVDGNKVVPCPLSEADDFYFAVMQTKEPAQTTTVPTVNNDDYGITMRMINFDSEGKDRAPVQTNFFGRDSNRVGLLSTNLDSEGYPHSTQGNNDSLSALFTEEGLKDVNHLFLKGTYDESGYFEYDSTNNFAHLNEGGDEDGTFTVYDQLLAVGNTITPTRTHGQFLPYNQIDTTKIASEQTGRADYVNSTDVLGNPLSDTNPRKGEELYYIPFAEADYFFGMEMSASFTQTASGLDAWGHDIIFEFSGDDDFWFYVDGELVLDLGGVHSAMEGSVNFRTGVVKTSAAKNRPAVTTTLRQVFEDNFKKRNPGATQAEVDAYLNEYFEPGKTVFRNYTNHDMKIFYMERGAGSSNLHMRFNLAAVKPGAFHLSKSLSGADAADNNLLEFPYQIYYTLKSEGSGEQHLLDKMDGDGNPNAVYAGTSTPVPFKKSFTPAGGTEAYRNVFFLKPGQEAEVTLPADVKNYYVVECGVNPDIYDQVRVNAAEDKPAGEQLTSRATNNKVGGTARKDYQTKPETLADRKHVDFDNHVSDGAMCTLSITKRLYDVDGQTPLVYPENDTLFDFRLFLGNENENASELPRANLYPYYVKDPQGYYCQWDAGEQKFVSLGAQTYEQLTAFFTQNKWTDSQKESVIFKTSPHGSISRIPAGYTVEVRDLIVGSHWKVAEFGNEIPKGYTLRLEDGYTRTDSSPEQKLGTTPASGTMERGQDPKVDVRNQKGWGLTVQKVWTDQDFMESHDTVYFAVYVKETGASGDTYRLLEDSVRPMKSPETSLYYFFGNLKADTPFANYVVREVVVEPVEGQELELDEETGAVKLYSAMDEHGQGIGDPIARVTPIEPDTVHEYGGKPIGGTYHPDPEVGGDTGYTYTVHYAPGQQTTQNENVRTDVVTNARPGIAFDKTDWAGGALAGAVFTLKDANGEDVAAETFTSRTDGRITVAYLNPGTYTLTEMQAPKGYTVIDEPLTITVDDQYHVTVNGPEGQYALAGEGDPDGMAARITVKDRPVDLQVVKYDANTSVVIPGTHFALYRQVMDAHDNPVRDYNPIKGYEDLVTDDQGVVPDITMNLPVGSYYLHESQPAAEYDQLPSDVRFTIGRDGTVSIVGGSSQLGHTQDANGTVHYVLRVPNGKMKKVSFKKVDIAELTHALPGAEFDLYRVVNGQQEETPLYQGMASGDNGMLALNGSTVFELGVGTYNLVETKAPDGYLLKADPVVVTVTAEETNAVRYDEGTTVSGSSTGVSYDSDSGVYSLTLTNSAGHELPHTGGYGTLPIQLIGLLFLAIGAGILAVRNRAFAR